MRSRPRPVLFTVEYVARHNGDCMALSVRPIAEWRLKGTIVRCFKDTFTFRLDDVTLLCLGKSPDSECTLTASKVTAVGPVLYHDEAARNADLSSCTNTPFTEAPRILVAIANGGSGACVFCYYRIYYFKSFENERKYEDSCLPAVQALSALPVVPSYH